MDAVQAERSNPWQPIAYGGLVLATALVLLRFYGLPSFPDRASQETSGDQSGWHIRNEPSFSVELPGEPVVSRVTGRNATDAGYREYEILSTHNGTNMIAIEMMEYLPDAQVKSGDEEVADGLNKIQTIENVQISTSSRFMLDGHPAARVDFFDPGNGQWTKGVLMYVDGSPRRYYTISELSADGRYTEGDFERVLESLRLF
jgi:hypothetical protein